MVRLFETHKIRPARELTGRLWRFRTLDNSPACERQVLVPSCWETYPGLGAYRGRAEYETEFEASGNIRIECKGVSHYAVVSVDGTEVARHYNAYTPFSFCVRNLPAGPHTLRITADNSFRDEYSLNIPNDYMSYGGISRPVVLEQVGELLIEWVHITPLRRDGGRWLFCAELSCRNLAEETRCTDVRLTVGDTEYFLPDRSCPPGESTISFGELAIDGAEEWSPENPALYSVCAQLEQNGAAVDDLCDRVGFRTVTTDGCRLLLNGKPVRIKGVCRHEDHPQYGCALPLQAIAADLRCILDLGANSVRTTHYPNDELFLDLCDELGILVWEENHARGLDEQQMRNPLFEPQCEQVIREMILSHYNHPCIYIWGILNECASDSVYGRTCYEQQYQLIQSLDPNRPYSSASCKFGSDICQDLESVHSWNMYPYWYEDDTASERLAALDAWLHQKLPNEKKPILVTEIGAGGIYGFRDSTGDYWSEELQAEILRKQLTETFAYENCIGLYIWQFCDIRVTKELWGKRRPRNRNNKGLVDEYRRPKLAFQVAKQIFSSLSNYQ